MEQLIKNGIDSVRKAHNLKIVASDSILYVAATDHSTYLIENKTTGHYQNKNKDKRSPQQRADYYGAKNYLVGENVAKTYVHKNIRDKKGNISINHTYRQTANQFVKLWVESPRHFDNLLQPNYEITGVSVSLDTVKGEIKAVQKFAEVQFIYSFEESKTLFGDFSRQNVSS